MKLTIIAALLGLSLAGFRGDMKKVGHFLSKHHKVIEEGLGDALKVGTEIASDEFINVAGLIEDGLKTIGDATQSKKDVAQLVEDGLKIIGDLTSQKQDQKNSEELFSSDPNGPWNIWADEFINVDGLIQDGVKTIEDATESKKNVVGLVGDALKIIGDLVSQKQDQKNSEELFSSDPNGPWNIWADEFINVDGLIQDGVKTIEDATESKKDVAQLVEDGLKIIGDLTSQKQDQKNSEELFSSDPNGPWNIWADE